MNFFMALITACIIWVSLIITVWFLDSVQFNDRQLWAVAIIFAITSGIAFIFALSEAIENRIRGRGKQ
jgi:TctA family transporter